MKKSVFLFFIILCSCGLPSSEDMQDLNPPLGLAFIALQCNGEVPNGITVRFYGYNPESAFSGYNIYVVKDNINAVNELPIYARDHVIHSSEEEPTFNTNVETNFMVKNDYDEFPSISFSDLSTYSTYQQKPTEITFTIKRPSSAMDNGFFSSGSIYSFGITAVSLSNKQETVLSNTIDVPVNCP